VRLFEALALSVEALAGHVSNGGDPAAAAGYRPDPEARQDHIVAGLPALNGSLVWHRSILLWDRWGWLKRSRRLRRLEDADIDQALVRSLDAAQLAHQDFSLQVA
jgi:hypothetical protein